MSITNRTVFYDNTDGIARFWDWAKVTTTIGSMVEPFLPNDRHSLTPYVDFDPTDEIAKITEIRAATIDQHMLILSGSDTALHGGYQLPHVGR